jgi:hypothetical protein
MEPMKLKLESIFNQALLMLLVLPIVRIGRSVALVLGRTFCRTLMLVPVDIRPGTPSNKPSMEGITSIML